MEVIKAQQVEQMIDLCHELLGKSYCVYSNFPVAAVLLTDCGKAFTGVNVENASFGLTICAERTAAVKAVSEGYKNIKACFVLTRGPGTPSPCGACRQFLAEFNLDMDMYLIEEDRKFSIRKLRDLLPMAFTPKELSEGQRSTG